MYCLAACRDASFRSLRRAEIYEKRGDRDKAVFHYSRFLELWKTAMTRFGRKWPRWRSDSND
jgi:hypothetical protein